MRASRQQTPTPLDRSLRNDSMLREDIPLRDALDLAFPYPMPGLIALEGPSGSTERAKPYAWIDGAFDKTLDLRHHVIEVLALPQ